MATTRRSAAWRSSARRLVIAVCVVASGGGVERSSIVAGGHGAPRDDAPRVAEGQPPPTPLTPELRAKILAAMRLNRQAFHEDAVLERYGERRPGASLPAFAACELPRTSSGAPAAQYPAKEARSTPRVYDETKVADCLSTTGGLSGTRATPLVQHYYCSLPGLSPDIRGCFTFQLRLPSVSRTRSAWEEGFLPDGTKVPIEKGWKFLGPDPMKVPDIPTVFNYCATDGRPHTVNTLKNKKRVALDVADVFPGPTRPMCWIVQTQADVFQGIMSGAINPPVADQVALLREYYECKAIKGKVSAARYKALCEYASR
jgi:hypothetical protein